MRRRGIAPVSRYIIAIENVDFHGIKLDEKYKSVLDESWLIIIDIDIYFAILRI